MTFNPERRNFLCQFLSLALVGCGGGNKDDAHTSKSQTNYDDTVDYSQSNKNLITDFQFSMITDRASFPSRDGAGLLEMNGRLYLIGGWSTSNHFPLMTANDVWISDNSLREWSEVKRNTWNKNFFDDSTWAGRHTAGYLRFNNRLWILGGDYNSGGYQSDIWNSVDGALWYFVANAECLSNRILFHSFVLNGYMWILGGQRIDDQILDYQSSYHHDAFRSSDGIHWERVIPVADKGSLFPSGMIQGYAKLDGHIYIIGGGYYGTNVGPRKFRNDVYRSPDGFIWELVTASAPWEPRVYASVASYAGRLWITSGLRQDTDPGGTEISDIWYSGDGKNWFKLSGEPWSGRHAASISVYEDRLIVLAGTIQTPNGRMTTSDIYELKIR